MNLIPRSSWHPDPARGFARRLVSSQVTGIVLHYPGTPGVVGTASAARVALLLCSYRRHHIINRGWPDIGYCYAVDQAGRAWTCAGDKVAAHSATNLDKLANHTNIGILLVVGNNEPLSDELVTTLRALIQHLRRKFTRIDRVRGHSQVPGAATSCPGNATRHLIAVGDLLNPNTSTPTTAPNENEDDMPKLSDQIELSDSTKQHLKRDQITYGGAQQYAAAGGWESMNRLPRIEATLKAQAAAINALAKAQGADSAAITRAVERAVTAALEGLEVTLTVPE